MKEKSKSKDLYIGELSFEAEEEDLQKLFSLCGTVRAIHMITDPKTGHSKGCAFVHMSTAAEAKDAINTLDGTRLINRCISVTEARPRKPAVPKAEKAKEKSPHEPRPRGRSK